MPPEAYKPINVFAKGIMHYGTVAKDHDVGKKKETIVANTTDHMELASKRRWLLKTPHIIMLVRRMRELLPIMRLLDEVMQVALVTNQTSRQKAMKVVHPV